MGDVFDLFVRRESKKQFPCAMIHGPENDGKILLKNRIDRPLFGGTFAAPTGLKALSVAFKRCLEDLPENPGHPPGITTSYADEYWITGENLFLKFLIMS